MRRLVVMVLLGVLVGCATGYHRDGFTGGYSETQLGEDIFQVSFRGNGYTRSERAADFNLLRCAELALENGFRYFAVVETEKKSQVSSYTTPSTSRTTARAYGSGNYTYGTATTTTSGGQTYLITKPSATNMIVCYMEKPQVDGLVFDAEFVRTSIRGKYGITK